jgi:hypothetical protein
MLFFFGVAMQAKKKTFLKLCKPQVATTATGPK